MATPIVTPIPAHPSEVQSWGSEGVNQAFGAIEAPKPRWSVPSIFYQDVAALERFGVDPLNPPSGRGAVLSANSYGYPIDGYTTGYTVKLPPSGADPQVAQRTPISGNQPTVVASSNGEDASPLLGIPSDEPVADQIAGVDWSNPWRRGEAIRKLQEQQKAAELLNSQTITPEQKIALTRYLNNEYGAPPATLPEASDNGRVRRPPIVPPPERNYDAPSGAVPRFKSREPTAALKRTRTRIKKAAAGKVLTEEQAAARRAAAVPLPSEGDILMPQA